MGTYRTVPSLPVPSGVGCTHGAVPCTPGPCPPGEDHQSLSHLPEQLWVREFAWDALQPWSHQGDSSHFPGANPELREARCPRRVAGQRAVPVPSLRARLPWAGHSRAPGPLCCGSVTEGPTDDLAGLSEPLPSVIGAACRSCYVFHDGPPIISSHRRDRSRLGQQPGNLPGLQCSRTCTHLPLQRPGNRLSPQQPSQTQGVLCHLTSSRGKGVTGRRLSALGPAHPEGKQPSP